MKITMHKENQEKRGSKFVTIEEFTKEITEKTYNRITEDDTLNWFRNIGGSERATKEYTCRGYKIVKLISTSPDREERNVRTFQFN